MHNKPERVKADAEKIRQLGGPAAVAAHLGYKVQRVHNWISRGIPPLVKLDRPDLFSRATPSGSEAPSGPDSSLSGVR
jgi:hypothetical protein